jgi:hypothetical protein
MEVGLEGLRMTWGYGGTALCLVRATACRTDNFYWVLWLPRTSSIGHIEYLNHIQYSEHNCKLFFHKKQRTNDAAPELNPLTLHMSREAAREEGISRHYLFFRLTLL